MTLTFIHNRNGTSQSQRNLDALNPDYFLLEERSITDLILFGQKHAEILRYYDSNNKIAGTWSAFLAGDPKELASFLNDPGFFDSFPEKKAKYSRPHLVLFLIFLKLLQESHALINKLTKKQLDFYYREALRFSTKKAVPDRVHVLANIHDDETQVLIPEGTVLQAGVNGQGDPVEYGTDQDLIADHSRVARLMSLYVEKEVTDISRLREDADPDKKFLSVLKMVYRKTGTKNSPRNYPYDSDVPPDRTFDQNIIAELDKLNGTISREFVLRIAAFQRLMEDYSFWNNEKTWETINKFLLVTFNRIKKSADENFKDKKIDDVFKDIRDFDNNFEIALGFSTKGRFGDKNAFDGIPAVHDVYDLYDILLRFPDDAKITTFITEKFHQEKAEFKVFMEARVRILGYMKSIHQYLKAAAFKNKITPGHWNHYQYKKDKTLVESFSNLLGVTPISFVDENGETKIVSNDKVLTDLETELVELEKYFRMPAEDYFFIRNLYLPKDEEIVPAWKWNKADQLLVGAYQSWINKEARESEPKKGQNEDSAEEEAGENGTGTGSLQAVSKIDSTEKPEIIVWKDVYQALDAKNLVVISTTSEEPFPRWKTFGAIPSEDSDPEVHFSSEIGLGITSPALALSEGNRELTLSFTFKKTAFEAQRKTLNQHLKYWSHDTPVKGPYPFHIEVSTEKGWVNLEEWQSFDILNDEPVMKIVVMAGEDLDPVAPLGDDENPTPFPWLRLILNKDAFGLKDPKVYELFKDQSLEQLELGIKVTGLKNLLVQNKEGSVDPQKPFDIFGSVPELGDRLYITHPELAAQKLSSLTVNLEWKNLPEEGLAKYYEEYSKLEEVPAITADSFKVKFSLIEGRRRLELSSLLDLFKAGESTQMIPSANIPDKFDNNGNAYIRKSMAETDPDVIDSDRYVEIELQPRDFLHNQYSAIIQKLANDSLKSSYKDGKYTPVTPPVLPEPYKPTLKSLDVDYETSVKINWTRELESTEDRFAHIEPFGQYFLPDSAAPVRFLPAFEKEGSLFIGLENLQPPQNVSLLFQLAEGTADPDIVPSLVKWSYLRGNDWAPLEKEKEVLTDTTGGLLSSGLIQIHVPGDASLHHKRMPDGLYWLRAEIERYSNSLSDCIDICTQAVSATWIESGEPSDHLVQPLPPETISEPQDPIVGLSSFTQPYSSFLGKAAEADDQLYRRASGVLRHKRRALTIWDYENLILEEFPYIYRAKAISADVWEDDVEAGSVRIVVIPDIRKRKPFDPFEPKVPVVRLREIQRFLTERAPAFSQIQVQNARFKYLQLRILVRFHDMNNFGFFAGKLNRELVEYLSPWAFENSANIMFGGKVYSSVIVEFIENRPYVDYIDKPGLQLMERNARGLIRVIPDPPLDGDGRLNITEPDVVIVSAHQHLIENLALPEATVTRIRQGIGFAKIEFDFRILTKKEALAARK